MSYRGRVVRRQPVSCSIRPQSIQEQKEQYLYLARVLNIRQYSTQFWMSATQVIRVLKERGLIVSLSSVYPDFGEEGLYALRLLPGQVMSLYLSWNNIKGVTFPPVLKFAGFLIQKGDGSWLNHGGEWSAYEPGISDLPAGLNVCTDGKLVSYNWFMRSQPLYYDSSDTEPYVQDGVMAKVIYFVHPLFAANLLEPAEEESFGSYLSS